MEERLAAHRRALGADSLRQPQPQQQAQQPQQAQEEAGQKDHSGATSCKSQDLPRPPPPLTALDLGLRLLLYALLQLLFAHFGLGVAFFAVAGLYFMWASSERRPRPAGQLSPFSVFNKNFQKMAVSVIGWSPV